MPMRRLREIATAKRKCVMCFDCYEKYGSPTINNPKVVECAKLIAQVYEHSPVGGYLHIVLDDWNLEDSNVVYCAEAIEKADYSDGFGNEDAERACCKALQDMTIEERASALGLDDGFWKIEQEDDLSEEQNGAQNGQSIHYRQPYQGDIKERQIKTAEQVAYEHELEQALATLRRLCTDFVIIHGNQHHGCVGVADHGDENGRTNLMVAALLNGDGFRHLVMDGMDLAIAGPEGEGEQEAESEGSDGRG